MAQSTALVTGATGGLGTAVSALFVEHGWRVVTPVRPGRDPAVLAADTEPVRADLTDPDAVAGAVAAAGSDPAAPLRAVVNLVGGFSAGRLVTETPIGDFEAMLTRNLRPTYLVTAAALPYLTGAGGGAVVCVSAEAARRPFPGAAGYLTAKAGVLAFANAVAVEYAPVVRCNTVLPGIIDTPGNRAAMPEADRSGWVDPAALARVIHFLASTESAPTTGAAVPVSG